MAAFEYAALDTGGKERKGVIEGDSPRQIRQQLREQGLIPLSVEEVEKKESQQNKTFSFSFRQSISAADLALLTRQLATLSQSGLPLDEATSTVARQSEKPKVKRLMMGVRSKVMEGHSLAEGLGKFPHAFPELYRATVAAGEQSGHLDTVLERLADYTEARQQISQKLQMAMVYPVLLTVMSILIIAGLMSFVVPKVVGVFENMGTELPLTTRILIGMSDFFREYIGWMFILMIAFVVGMKYLLNLPGPKYKFHLFKLRLPLIGRFIRGMNTARFSRTLSILAGSGVPVLDALRISAQVVSNLPMREAVMLAAHKIREGAGLAKSLEQSGYFPPMTVNLIASGESSGKLEDMLERAAVTQEREQDAQISMLMGLMEPLLILFMGGVVLFIVLSILVPIFDMNRLVR